MATYLRVFILERRLMRQARYQRSAALHTYCTRHGVTRMRIRTYVEDGIAATSLMPAEPRQRIRFRARV